MKSMHWRITLISGLCALLLSACGGGDPNTAQGPGTGGTGGGPGGGGAGGIGLTPIGNNGDVGSAGGGSPGTSLFYKGYVSGTIELAILDTTPSVTVAGLVLPISGAKATRYDGTPVNLEALQAGQNIEVLSDAGFSTSNGTGGTATTPLIRLHEQLRGPVSSVQGDTLTLLGQTVRLDRASTQVDATSLPQGLASIQAGDLITVHASLDVARGQYLATHISREASPSSPTTFLLEGLIATVDPLGATVLLNMGSDLTLYECPIGSLKGRQAGDTVRIQLAATLQANGQWHSALNDHQLVIPASHCEAASSISKGQTGISAVVAGVVTRVGTASAPSQKRDFTVNGVNVDASALATCPVCDSLSVGSTVRVEGTLDWPGLRAGKVE